MGRKNYTNHNGKPKHRHSWIEVCRRDVYEIAKTNIFTQIISDTDKHLDGIQYAKNNTRNQVT